MPTPIRKLKMNEAERNALAEGYRQMAADREREAGALERCEALIGDVADNLEPMTTDEKEQFFRDAVQRDDAEFDVYND